ncbi:hypothetical protein Bca4012_013162 [Brassica carinata]
MMFSKLIRTVFFSTAPQCPSPAPSCFDLFVKIPLRRRKLGPFAFLLVPTQILVGARPIFSSELHPASCVSVTSEVTSLTHLLGYSSTDELIRWDQEELDIKYGAPAEYPPQPEVEFGFPQSCYCGGAPVLRINATGRLYYTCDNADDGECHVWKLWDVAVMEEMRARDRHVLQLQEKVDNLAFLNDFETEQRLVRVEKLVGDLANKRSGFSFHYLAFVVVLIVALAFIRVVICFK